jgi:hypothetical protein
VESSEEERFDPENCILMAAHLDAAFDVGLISFTDLGFVQTSAKLSEEDKRLLGLADGTRLTRSPSREQQGFLAWHRKHRFLG